MYGKVVTLLFICMIIAGFCRDLNRSPGSSAASVPPLASNSCLLTKGIRKTLIRDEKEDRPIHCDDDDDNDDSGSRSAPKVLCICKQNCITNSSSGSNCPGAIEGDGCSPNNQCAFGLVCVRPPGTGPQCRPCTPGSALGGEPCSENLQNCCEGVCQSGSCSVL